MTERFFVVREDQLHELSLFRSEDETLAGAIQQAKNLSPSFPGVKFLVLTAIRTVEATVKIEVKEAGG